MGVAGWLLIFGLGKDIGEGSVSVRHRRRPEESCDESQKANAGSRVRALSGDW